MAASSTQKVARTTPWLLGLCLTLLLGLTHAQTAQAKGSHFLLELNNGLSMPMGYEDGYASGYALGMTVGVGGKFKGNPTRFYFIGQFNTGSFSAERTYNNRIRFVERQVTDVNGGLRMLWPLSGISNRLRLYTDLTLGMAQIESKARTQGLPERFVIRDTDTDFAFFAGVGLQYRLFYHVSLGMKADFGFVFDDEEFDVVADATSPDTEERLGRTNLYFTATLHF
ncbi:MAG: outer membrane beta-barrel protein [Myxococcota bacterium]